MNCKPAPKAARKLARHIVRDIVFRFREGNEVPEGVRVDIVSRRWSVLDRARLFLGETEVWIPLLQRLRLRRAIRRRLLRKTYEAIHA